MNYLQTELNHPGIMSVANGTLTFVTTHEQSCLLLSALAREGGIC
jgi:hypothetical protein